MKDLDFSTFFYIWSQHKGWEVPKIHIEITEFLDDYKNWEARTGVLQVFRSAGKSTILGLYIVYLLLKDPTLRILVLSADAETAKKVVADCKSIISLHPLAKSLMPDVKNEIWRSDCFNVKGATDARNFSVQARGIISNVTGSRSDIIIHDDVEVPKNCDSEMKRGQLRMKIAEAANLLIANTGVRLFVGTPHSYESIYPEFIKDGCSSLRIPLLTNYTGEFPKIKGDTAWPEHFNEDEIFRRQSTGKTKGNFFSQYLLIPQTIEDSILDPNQIVEYKDEVEFGYANKTMYCFIGEHRIASVGAFWDVSVNRTAGDDSVVAIVFFSDDGKIFVHRTVAMMGNIEEQSKQCSELLRDYKIPMIVVETNGVGAFVPQILLKHTIEYGIGVDGRATTKNKAIKILEAFEVPLADRFLYCSDQVMGSKFVNQLRDFKPAYMKSYQHDDFIDAAASVISDEPIRIATDTLPGMDKLLDFNYGVEKSGEYKVDMATL